MNDFIGKNYTVPQLDMSVKPENTAEKYAYLYEQTVVDDSESYLGHPDSVLLKNGDIDCLWCDYSPNYREDDYYWTEPYLTVTVSVAAKKTSGIKGLASLDRSKTIAVIAGSVSERRLLAGDLEISPDVQIKSYGSAELCKAALAKGYVDCWMADVQPLDRLVAQYPGLYCVFADNVMTVDLGVAFKDGYEGEYVKNLNTVLFEMDRDGTIERIVGKYKAGATTDGQGAES